MEFCNKKHKCKWRTPIRYGKNPEYACGYYLRTGKETQRQGQDCPVFEPYDKNHRRKPKQLVIRKVNKNDEW